MLILLPPSEGKTPPSGPAFTPANTSWPELHSTRTRVIKALDAVLKSAAHLESLKLSGAAAREFPRNANLARAATGPAHEVYTGVLFQALDYAGLTDLGRRRAAEHLAITSALWGLVRPGDQIPAYRLSAGMKLPGLGSLTTLWKSVLPAVLAPVVEAELIVDARSGPYVAMWKPRGIARENWFPVRVFQERDGKRTVVSHHAKHARGLLARHLLLRDQLPETGAELEAAAGEIPGFLAEITPNPRPTRTSLLQTLDLIARA